MLFQAVRFPDTPIDRYNKVIERCHSQNQLREIHLLLNNFLINIKDKILDLPKHSLLYKSQLYKPREHNVILHLV